MKRTLMMMVALCVWGAFQAQAWSYCCVDADTKQEVCGTKLNCEVAKPAPDYGNSENGVNSCSPPRCIQVDSEDENSMYRWYSASYKCRSLNMDPRIGDLGGLGNQCSCVGQFGAMCIP